MKTKTVMLTLTAAAVLGATAWGFYALGRHQSVMQAGQDHAGASAKATERKVLYWHDPMVPTQKFDKPGKSPFMDMELVPVYADEAGSDENKLSISSQVQQNLGIRTAEVSKGSLANTLTAVGSVSYNERDMLQIQARSNGFVEKLHVRATLDTVKKGQVLAELYAPDWVGAQEEYLSVRHMQGNLPEGLLDAARQRMRLAGMNDAQIHAVEVGNKVLARTTITAPADGVVSEIAVREGMSVATGAPLFRINGVHTVWVNAEVPENAVAQLRPGVSVEARTPALPGVVFKGKVAAILPQVNTATRTLQARIELTNPSGQLLPGMFVTVSFSQAASPEVILIPTEAVIQTGTRSVVMVAQEGGKFLPVEVEIGDESRGQTEIRKGLEVGQKVVVSGQFLIDSEASLKATATRMGAADANRAANAADMSKAGHQAHGDHGKPENGGKP